MTLQITSICSITPQAAHLNGKSVLQNAGEEGFQPYAKKLYKKCDIAYPKFFKMDELCQLAFLGTELLTSHVEDWNGDQVAVVLGNKHSSLSSDRRHYSTIVDQENYFPSPAVFVYTLPNIMLGEICIRHKITGENSCFMMEALDAEFLHDYVNHLFEIENYRYCIAGFVDYTDQLYTAQLFLIEAGAPEGTPAFDFDKNFNQLIP